MNILQTIEQQFKKPAVVAVETGDTVRVHQRIREGGRERVQIFEGLIIRVDRRQSLTCRITVRKIASGVGVEKGFMIHGPNVVKIEVIKRAIVRRNFISYIRRRTGKSARLKPRPFDPKEVNLSPEAQADNQPAADKAQQPEPVADNNEPAASDPKPAEAELTKTEDSPANQAVATDSSDQTDKQAELTDDGQSASTSQTEDSPDSRDNKQD